MIVILPDADDAGTKYGKQVADIAVEHGFSVKIIELPDLPSGGDYVDWRDRLVSSEDGIDGVEVFRKLLTLVDEAVQYQLPKEENEGNVDASNADDVEPAVLQPEALNKVLAGILPVDWTQYERVSGKDGEKIGPPSERDYILRTIERILLTAKAQNVPLVCKDGQVFIFSETHYVPIDETAMKTALIEFSIACGVPNDTAVYQFFVEKLFRQFLICVSRQRMSITEPEGTFINLRNGTLFFGKNGAELKEHSPKNFIRYCLSFDYNPDATCQMWDEHLRRSLPDAETADYLAECFALPFYSGKIEKVLILCGQPSTGKSVSLDVLSAILGSENISCEIFQNLTSTDTAGYFSRNELDGRLANIATDVSNKLGDSGLAKMLISRESVSARPPYGKNIKRIKNYARLLFAMNELPPQFLTDGALKRRAAFIEFPNVVSQKETDTGYAQRIIAGELSGVLNWIIAGLGRLLDKGKLEPPTSVAAVMERVRIENDPLSGWLAEKEYCVGNETYLTVKESYQSFSEYCRENGNAEPSRGTFTRRLKALGYTVEKPNGHVGWIFRFSYFHESLSEFTSPASPAQSNSAATLENTVHEAGTEWGRNGDAMETENLRPHYVPEGGSHETPIKQGHDGVSETQGTLGTQISENFCTSEENADENRTDGF